MNAKSAALLAEPAAALGRFLAQHAVDARPFFEHLVPAAAIIDGNRELARTLWAKAVGSEGPTTLVDALIWCLDDCEHPYFQAFPQELDELELRSRPLRELWEARGPGLLAGVARRTDRRLLVDDATVNLAQPFLGGGGYSHAPYNSVTLEAVLADPNAKLPETVRLAWLLSTLASDLPDFAESFSPGAAPTIVSLAMLPVVLEAAADVEWVRPDEALLASAAELWEAPQPAGERTVEIVGRWWDVARRGRAPWTVSLKALERLLTEA